MTRLLRELDRADARAYNPRTRRPGDAGRRLAAVFAATALIVVVGGGFAHVDDPDELMYADNVGRLDLGPGDRRGLVALGSGRCIH